MRWAVALLSLGGLIALLAAVACRTPASPGAPTAPPGGVGLPPAAPATGVLPSGVPGGYPVVIAPTQQTGIWVLGTGKVSVEPSLAILTLGVEARAKSVEEARSQAASAMNGILGALKANGIPDKDVQTRSFSITPHYVWRERVGPGGERSGEQVLVGYIARSDKAVKVRKLEGVGRVIDDAVKAGGDLVRVQGVHFTVEDLTPYHAKARDLAVKDALARAEQFSRLAGVALGKAVYMTEVGGPMPVVREFGIKEAMPVPAPAAPTPITGGELEIQVTVQVAFAIQ